jgi:hemerythrin superfamily protein
MDAIELLRKDHQKVTELFRRFNGGGGLTGIVNRVTGNISERQRRTAAEQICRELDLHALVEEEVFYPAVRSLNDDQLNGMLSEALQEHATVKQEVAMIRRGIGKDPDLQTKMNELQTNVDHHVREEEGEMFPRVGELMEAGRREVLARAMQARKRQGAKAAPTPARKAGGRRTRSTTAAKGPRVRQRRAARAKTRKRASTAGRSRARTRRAK